MSGRYLLTWALFVTFFSGCGLPDEAVDEPPAATSRAAGLESFDRTVRDDASGIFVEVTRPERDGVDVGRNYLVQGTARLPAGHHLWAFARRTNFAPEWWPQHEGKIDPKTGEWKILVRLGEEYDVGWRFDVAVVVVTDEAHFDIENYFRDAHETGFFPSILMPEVAAPPITFQVKKVSHK